MYEELMTKAERCKLNALRAESDWARNYWDTVAQKLELQARGLLLNEC